MSKVLRIWDAAIGEVDLNLQGPTTAKVPLAVMSAGAGGSAAVINGAGDLQAAGQTNPQVSIAGISPGATGADNVLATFLVPASIFDVAGRGLNVVASGNCPNTNAKTLKIIVNPATAVVGSTVGGGGTTIASLTATGANTQGGWQLEANIFKAGAAGSNTQLALHQSAQVASTVGALVAPSSLTLTESGTILVAITGNATTAVGDIVFNFLEIFAMN